MAPMKTRPRTPPQSVANPWTASAAPPSGGAVARPLSAGGQRSCSRGQPDLDGQAAERGVGACAREHVVERERADLDASTRRRGGRAPPRPAAPGGRGPPPPRGGAVGERQARPSIRTVAKPPVAGTGAGEPARRRPG